MDDQIEIKKRPRAEDWGAVAKKPFRKIEDDHNLYTYYSHHWGDDHELPIEKQIMEIFGDIGLSQLSQPVELKENPPQWVVDRIKEEFENFGFANNELKNLIEMQSEKRGGVPVFKGTGISISQFIAELADNQNISDISKDFSLSIGKMRKLLHALAIILDKSYDKNTIR